MRSARQGAIFFGLTTLVVESVQPHDENAQEQTLLNHDRANYNRAFSFRVESATFSEPA